MHDGAPAVPAGLAALLERLGGAMEAHMQKEEQILFPAIRQGGMPGIEQPIAAMRADHADHAEDLAAIRALTNDLEPPADACRSWQALYAGLGQFAADLKTDMRLENEVLFPPFETP